MRLTVVPNGAGDRQGGANALFSALTPILDKGKQLKKSNRTLYKCLKQTVNAIFALILLALLAAILAVPYSMLSSF
jgi:beta-hydroxylase